MKRFFTCFFLLNILFTLPLVAASHRKLTSSALGFQEESQKYLLPVLQVGEDKLYLQDRSYLREFPFHSYTVLYLPTQGYFLDDHINDTIKNCLRKRQPWEAHIQRIIRENIITGSTVLDIGAHIGTHTVTMSKAVGSSGRVFAFEPGKKIYRELSYNLALNECNNVVPLRCALGKEHSVIEVISSHPCNEGGSYVIQSEKGENRAVLLALDELELSHVSFIKIDVENMEADVLRGAVQTIQTNRPIMLIEIQGNGERPIQLNEDTKKMHQESISLIQSLGYRLVLIRGHDYLAIPL